jgi:hypothetical protein
MGRVFLVAVFGALLPAVAGAQSSGASADATCDATVIRSESYALATEAQGLNVLRPREPWWERFGIKGPRELGDLNEGATLLAERARELDDRNLLAHGYLARQYVVTAVDARKTEDTWRRVLDNGGAIVWTATLDAVDARSYFVVAFDRSGIRIFRFGDLAGPLRTHFGVPDFPMPEREEFWRALGGCLPENVSPVAEIPWSSVREIRPATWALRFELSDRVEIESDRGRRRSDDRLEILLHSQTGIFDPRFAMAPFVRPVFGPPSLDVDPAAYQLRVLQMLRTFFDPDKRIRS